MNQQLEPPHLTASQAEEVEKALELITRNLHCRIQARTIYWRDKPDENPVLWALKDQALEIIQVVTDALEGKVSYNDAYEKK